MKATIKTYQNNADLFFGDYWDGMSWSYEKEWNEWAEGELSAIEDAENYEDVKLALRVATDSLVKARHAIEQVELLKGNYGGDILSYVADGEYVYHTGEFNIDRDGYLHHSHIFEDEDEIEITVKYF